MDEHKGIWVKMKDTGKVVRLGDRSAGEQLAQGLAEPADAPKPTARTRSTAKEKK